MDKEILNMEEAAELFGVSIKTFIKLLKEEKVPARKIGREWRFSRKALIDWLSSGDSQAYSASEGEAKEFFNKVAPEWEEIRKDYYDESIKNKIFELDILEPDMTVMDLGAGSGYISRTVAPHVKKVIAVDISGQMLSELRKKAYEEGIGNIQTLENDGRDVAVPDSTADVVFASMYLHHIEEPLIAIKEIKRILKSGGRVFLADYNEHTDMELKEKMHDIWMGFRQEDIREWFAGAGFKDIRIYVLDEHSKKQDSAGKPGTGVFIATAVK
ncbi:MAG: methyltransferase domain-containing protein [Clostridiales bacterium]|jgi:excisionase family DNA binding protein|nr:methyltransferase domain-containing protein [Eubacteriales bacterium]MDH7565803.1 methyltransferase domain-containing protein [Clostridiales bacterium]